MLSSDKRREGSDPKQLIILESGVAPGLHKPSVVCFGHSPRPMPGRGISFILGLEEGAMSAYWMWWIAAAALIAAELLTGTFYLLAVGIAVACGGVAAWLGAPIPVQWLIAGALGVVGTMLLQRWKRT